MSADGQLKSFIDRVLRLKEEQDELSKDIRDVYGEAKSMGYDKTVMGKLVAYLRKIEKSGPEAADEAEAVFDTYLSAYQRASGMRVATHTHEEDFDPSTGEILGSVDAKLVQTIAAGVQTETGRKALIAAVDIMIEREEAEERRSDGGLDIITKHTEIATASQGEAGVPSDERETDRDASADEDCAGANAGGDDVDSSAERAGPEGPSLIEPTGPVAERATNSPEAASETPKQVYGDSVEDATAPPSQSVDIPAGGESAPEIDGSKEECPADPNSPEEAPKFLTKAEEGAEAKGAATVDPVSRAEAETDRQRSSEAGPTDGRRQGGVEPSAAAVAPAPSFLTKPPSPLRPNCQRPENCGGYGRTHCGICLRAKEREMA
ncbi:UNVERIFIED_ORG: uncharacterized protein (UPF0335 family) [Ensifer adhaerens]|nr:uncharacterized protein (UPF0335 family) [Ensifer adhaerens]